MENGIFRQLFSKVKILSFIDDSTIQIKTIKFNITFTQLRWNDYESNIIASFRDLRKRSELFDVTLCCDNGFETVQVSATLTQFYHEAGL